MDGKAMFPTAVSVEGKRMIFLSGQLAWDKDGNTVGKGDMRAQFEQVSENLKNGLEAAGASRHDDRDRQKHTHAYDCALVRPTAPFCSWSRPSSPTEKRQCGVIVSVVGTWAGLGIRGRVVVTMAVFYMLDRML